MADDPTEVLHSAVIAHLRSADYGLDAIVADRVFDDVPQNSVLPWIVVDAPEILDDSADCFDGAIATINVHCFSDKKGRIQVQQIAAGVREALSHLAGEDLTLTGHRLLEIYFDRSIDVPEPDGITKHVQVTFTALTEPA